MLMMELTCSHILNICVCRGGRESKGEEEENGKDCSEVVAEKEGKVKKGTEKETTKQNRIKRKEGD